MLTGTSGWREDGSRLGKASLPWRLQRRRSGRAGVGADGSGDGFGFFIVWIAGKADSARASGVCEVDGRHRFVAWSKGGRGGRHTGLLTDFRLGWGPRTGLESRF